jgi:GT2 family glycosyltransferase
MKYLVAVLCRNGLAMTKKAVVSIRAQTLKADLLVIDNASQDGTLPWLLTQQALVMAKAEPDSVSGCWNQALRWAFDYNDYEAVLVCNNDIELRPDTLEWLVRDGGEFVTPVSVGSREQLTDTPPTSTRPHPDFSCFLLRKSVWDKVGPFDENYKGAYCEDADFHLRMHRASVNAYCIDLPYLHWGSGTISNAQDLARVGMRRQADRNREYFKAKYGFGVGSEEYYAAFGTTSPEVCPL